MTRLLLALLVAVDVLALLLAWLARCPDFSEHAHHAPLWHCALCEREREWRAIERRLGE